MPDRLATLIPAWVNGELTPVDKLHAHREGLRHKAVSVFVLRGREILLQRRAMGKYHTPGLWANTCCTHPMWQEASDLCALRRLQEELGLTGLQPQYRHTLEYRADVGNGLTEHEVVDVYLAEMHSPLDLSPNPDEVMETRWVDYQELLADVARDPDRFTPWLKIYLADHADVIFDLDLIAAADG
ncbi:isopentenyl-diphosphate Delta-isomerase [Phaeobacter sp. B1627]|uniref:isopentenyl-diphosphate Delta-isomerase n=1 Tax=Phaeobacter sp. B1627 TaxID=2583809 RepID=UPI001118E26B|nr:isopentenyl-diphosphate Delta-isomerase [Phaeobacter sp. B1627]TNJ41433.1 isopentenyl-diphosphate Delta-isomerase [Phaeobacter sp. B1627]